MNDSILHAFMTHLERKEMVLDQPHRDSFIEIRGALEQQQKQQLGPKALDIFIHSIHSQREKSFFSNFIVAISSLFTLLSFALCHSNLNKYYTRKRDLRKALFSLLFYIFRSFAQEMKSILQFLDFWITFIVLLRVKKKKMKISSQRVVLK